MVSFLPKLCYQLEDLRGTGEWTEGQHSWNISLTNEVRGGANRQWNLVEPFFAQEKIAKTNKYTSY